MTVTTARIETLEAALELLTSPTPHKVEMEAFSAENLSRREKRRLGEQLKRTRDWDIGGNIVGYGIAPSHSKSGEVRDLALAIYVKKMYSADDLDSSRLVPNELDLEGLSERVPVDVEEIGELRLEALTARVRPVIGGYSIGHLLATGTAG